MAGKAISCGLSWDFVVPDSIDQTQRWVLSAMQSHGQQLVTMLWRIFGNEQDVCDAYQSTFLQLAHYQNRQKPQHVKAYLFRTAANVAISMLRTKIAEKKSTAAVAACKDVSSPANQLDCEYLQQTLRRFISQLPEHLRNVITLRDLAELSYTQIGRILGISASTARVYRCKAIQLLAVWMNKEKDQTK